MSKKPTSGQQPIMTNTQLTSRLLQMNDYLGKQLMPNVHSLNNNNQVMTRLFEHFIKKEFKPKRMKEWELDIVDSAEGRYTNVLGTDYYIDNKLDKLTIIEIATGPTLFELHESLENKWRCVNKEDKEDVIFLSRSEYKTPQQVFFQLMLLKAQKENKKSYDKYVAWKAEKEAEPAKKELVTK